MSNETSDGLLPCPFCGGKTGRRLTIIRYRPVDPQSYASDAVSCGCSAKIHSKVASASDEVLRQSAIDTWNTRTALPHPTPAFDAAAVREACARVHTLDFPDGSSLRVDYPETKDWAKSWTFKSPTGGVATQEQDWEVVEHIGLTAILESYARALPLPEAPASVHAGMRAADMLETAKELRANSNGRCGDIREAIMWEGKAASILALADHERTSKTVEDSEEAVGCQQEAVGIAGSMPGTSGFTMAVFKAADVPIGTPLYAHPAPQAQGVEAPAFATDEMVEAGLKTGSRYGAAAMRNIWREMYLASTKRTPPEIDTVASHAGNGGTFDPLDPGFGGGVNDFTPKPMTAGIHQRADGTYFRVHYMEPEPGVGAGWYWDGCDHDGVWDGDWISGPYSTVEQAADDGWHDEVLSTGTLTERSES